MQTEINTQDEKSKNYLKDCFMQKCRNEYDDYLKDEESALDRYAKLSIQYLQFISLGIFSTAVLLQSPLNFNFIAAFLALSVLVFFISVTLILRYSLKNSKDIKLKNDIYDAWTKTVLYAILINLLLIFVENGLNQILVVLFFATIAIIFIQKSKKTIQEI
ncbi:hypothetical protein [Arcobacter arenosus]|jgi:hypothetical protein|uniref:Uncharacterized protein n=1 Tax=Arcobacter arenosus TaxID=2576037 RepID=A0A5R8XZB1_9BACT|nr:hypothetical protein [Arcobacter arenosus]TLP36927.1 hypothetical protein FDK22_11820 [Arcobacter arenosus]